MRLGGPKGPTWTVLDNPHQLNLLRLFRWHGMTNANVANLLGSTAHTVGDWISGKRAPGANYMLLIGRLFAVDPRDLYDLPARFGQRIADPSRLDEMDKLEWRRRGWDFDGDGVAWGERE